MPCNDRIEEAVAETSKTHQDHKDSTEKHSDLCSPFCSCSCCGIQLTQATYSFYQLEQEIYPTYSETVSYQPQKEFGIIYGIWQPP